MANAASSNATVANSLFPLQKVENFRYMGYDSSSLHEQIRCDIGKAPSPTVAIIDSQFKTTELANSRGFDAHKKVKGRKRHIVTDTIGIPLGVKVTCQCQ